MTTNVDVVTTARRIDGKPYIFGTEVRLSDPDPKAFDCSEAVQWIVWQAGYSIAMPDGTWYQANHCLEHGQQCSYEDALVTPGLLWFDLRDSHGRDIDLPHYGPRPTIAHVGITDGLAWSWEARSTRHGCGRFALAGRHVSYVFTIPGVIYLPPDLPPTINPGDDEVQFYRTPDNTIYAVGMTDAGVRKQHVTDAWVALRHGNEAKLIDVSADEIAHVPDVAQ